MSGIVGEGRGWERRFVRFEGGEARRKRGDRKISRFGKYLACFDVGGRALVLEGFGIRVNDGGSGFGGGIGRWPLEVRASFLGDSWERLDRAWKASTFV